MCIGTWNSVLCLFGRHYSLPERISKAQLPLQAGMNERITSTNVHEEYSILARRLDSCCCEILTNFCKESWGKGQNRYKYMLKIGNCWVFLSLHLPLVLLNSMFCSVWSFFAMLHFYTEGMYTFHFFSILIMDNYQIFSRITFN